MATLQPGPLQPVWHSQCQLCCPMVHWPFPLHRLGQPSERRGQVGGRGGGEGGEGGGEGEKTTMKEVILDCSVVNDTQMSTHTHTIHTNTGTFIL